MAPASAPPKPAPQEPKPPAEVQRILAISVPLAVMLAERYMPIESILEVTAGTIVEFDVPFDSDLTLEVAGRPIAQGQAVKIGENFGIRISRIGSIKQRIDALGGV
jgi:flagellar motor switch protein FliN/FliY